MESDRELYKKILEWKAAQSFQPVESVEQEAASSTTKDGVGEKATALHHFQRPQEAGYLLQWMKWK